MTEQWNEDYSRLDIIAQNGATGEHYMNLKAYQEWTREVAVYPPKQSLEYLGLEIASEAGEVCGVLKKWIRDKGSLNNLYKELGDVVWGITRLADELGWNIEDIIEANRAKLSDRKERCVLHGSGDER